MNLNGGELIIIRNSLVERRDKLKEKGNNVNHYNELINKIVMEVHNKTLKEMK
jgi:hypothetical protein